ncbi:MAG: DUF1501 domain-containing protein [Planctomycetota bacterium]|nr:DUF1501 domain-containing protein [Planctomycetota bacterium]
MTTRNLDFSPFSASRRELMQIGSLGAFGLGLPHWLAGRAYGETTGTAKSVILLWLYGGPSHIDTIDPKPLANSEIRSPFSPIDTSVPGIQITELLPQLSQRIDRCAILRGMYHENSDHNVGGTIALTGVPAGGKVGGGAPLPGDRHPTLGSLVTRLISNPSPGWPSFMCIGEPAKVSGAASGQDAAGFGAIYEPFRLEYKIENGLKVPEALNLIPGLSADRLGNRRELLTSLDSLPLKEGVPDTFARLGQFYDQAMGLLTSSEARKAVDLQEETTKVRNRYGKTRFGQSCLLARRLVESGVPFVQVNWSDYGEDQQTSGGDGGWDHHWRLYEFIQDHCAWSYDQAITALLDDLEDRGLLDETLVLAMGEFGRTPKINGCGGRDHWANVYSILMAGGGVRGGQVIGSSDLEGGYPADRPVHPQELHATVLKAMGLDRLALIPLGVTLNVEPVHELF